MSFTGLLTLIFSATGAAGVVLNEVRRYRGRARLNWALRHMPHYATDWRMELRNHGNARPNKVDVLGAGCDVFGGSGANGPVWHNPEQDEVMAFNAQPTRDSDLENAFVVVVAYFTAPGPARIEATWFPLRPEGRVHAEFLDQSRKPLRWKVQQRLLRQWYPGPGGVLTVRLRLRLGRGERVRARLERGFPQRQGE